MVHTANTPKEVRKCYYCESAENEPRIIGNYIVKLTSVIVGDNSQLACQGCSRKVKTQETNKNKSLISKRLSFFGFRKKPD